MDPKSVLDYITDISEEQGLMVPSGVEGSLHLSSEECLKIYRDDYKCRIQDIMRTHFPMVERVLGEDLFLTIINPYIQNTPAESWNIEDYGHSFPEFLEFSSQAQSLLNDYPFLIDLAKLEWAFHQKFHEIPSEFENQFEGHKVSSLNPENLNEVNLNPTLEILKSDFQIPKIYRAAQKEGELDQKDWLGSSYYFLSNFHYSVTLEEVTPAGFQFLELWKKLHSLSLTIEYFEQNLESQSPLFEELGPLILRLSRLGLVSRNALIDSNQTIPFLNE